MKLRSMLMGMTFAMVLLAGCQKKEQTSPVNTGPVAPKPDTVALVKKSEQSRHFAAVNRQLELGGMLYGYADIDGDVLKLATSMQGVLGEIAKAQPQASPFLKQDLGAIFQILGLTDIKAVGLSSVGDETGFFRNRVFFYTPDKRRGLLAGLGGDPAPFARLHLAPADADVYSEGEIDLAAIYQALMEVVTKVGGEESANKMEQGLKMAGQKATISFLSLVQNWKGRTAMVLRIDEGPGLRLPGPTGAQLPAFSLLLSVDGIAPTLRESLVNLPMLKQRKEGEREIFELKQAPPIPGLNPVIVIDGSTLMLVTSPQFMDECLQAKSSLGQTEEFKTALARFGDKANGLGYVSPRLFKKLSKLETMNAHMPPEKIRVLKMVLAQLPETDRPLVTVRTNLPDGILISSYWNRSLKQDLAAISVYNPVTVGLMAAMAIPAFQKVRTASQEKAVLNNLRQLAAAADQDYLENGVERCTYVDLVGPKKYIRRINPVAGEDYTQLQFAMGVALKVKLPTTGRFVEYAP